MAEPLTAAQLVAAFKAEGVTVREPHSGWPDHQRDEETGKPFGPVHGVLIHHTAGHGDYEVVYSGNAALPGPRAHAYINKAGEALMCSAGRANHAGGGDRDVLNAVTAESYMTRPPATRYGEGDAGAVDGNDAFYGFECENLGDGQDPWPRVQYVAMVKAAAAICRHYGWSEKSVIGHLEWSHYKVDPRGFDMVAFRADVKACLALPAGQWGSTQEEDDMPSAAEIAKAVWEYQTDDPRTSGTQPITLKSLLWWAGADSAQALAAVKAQGAVIDQLVKTVAQLAAGLGDLRPEQIIAELKSAIESVTVHLDVPEG